MISLIFEVLANAAVIVGLSRVMPQIQIKDFTTAIIVAVLVAVLNVLIGWIIKFPLNLVSFFLLGSVVRLVATAIIIKLVDAMLDSFNVQGFWPALVIGLAIAVVGSIFDGMGSSRQTRQTNYQRTSYHVTAPMMPTQG